MSIPAPHVMNAAIQKALGLEGRFVTSLTMRFERGRPPTLEIEELIGDVNDLTNVLTQCVMYLPTQEPK